MGLTTVVWCCLCVLIGPLQDAQNGDPGQAPPEVPPSTEQTEEPHDKPESREEPPERAWDLLRIAETESRRAAERLEAQVSQRLLDVTLLRPDHPRVTANIVEIAALGPDVTPLLLNIVRETNAGITSSNRTGEYAVRALLLVFRQTGDQEILAALQRILREDDRTARLAILRGIVSLDHPLALQMAQPFLADEDSRISRAAITVISHQSSQTSAGLLRPLLVPDGPNVDLVISSLQRLEDSASAEAVGRVLAGSKSRPVRTRAVSFLSEYGGLDVLPFMAQLLEAEPAQDEDDFDAFKDLQSSCLSAIMEIGLRTDGRPSQKAKDILVDFWSSTKSIKLRADAGWSLGPYRYEPAFEDYERRYKNDIRSRQRKTDPTPYLNFAKAQVRFEKWDDALNSLKRAASMDEKGVMTESIARLRGAAYCGQEKFDRAEREFLTIQGSRSDLPVLFRSVRAMARMPKYQALFQDA